MRTTKIMPLSMLPESLREALRRRLSDGRWRRLREYGAKQSKQVGVRQSEVERLIHEYRREQRGAG
ncbi:MAG: hypothetical protein HY858_03955 [Candidatus Solibacter usitatus]|nr:hypothetical protein [Candidatus Solibacter usitatus]